MDYGTRGLRERRCSQQFVSDVVSEVLTKRLKHFGGGRVFRKLLNCCILVAVGCSVNC
jgi:hypothetical protein